MNDEMLVNHPKTKRGMKTLEKLLLSAEMNFQERGYHRTSIIDITRSAGVALGTYYVYFNDKVSIYKYLLLQYSRRIRHAIVDAINSAGVTDRKQAERVGLKAFLQYIYENKHIYNIIWESLYIDKSLFVDYYTTFAKYYKAQLDAAKSQGEIKDVDTEVLAYMLMGISNFIGLKMIIFDDRNDFDDVVDEVIRILDQGIFTHGEGV